ncbi:HAD-IC family P-type ATPase [Kitasatospora sp. NPDC018058]|uniref:HAD-IC family P-type ATPase n=1 Tax=Kitasatospora sp. NPDC018058 TaxID=3364025 RepID=UPI0037C08721
MAEQAGPSGPQESPDPWYARPPQEVASSLGVDPATGLTAARAAELLASTGPNALPEEKPRPGWLRFLDQYRSYMQIILVVSAVVSLAIKERSTAVLLLALTLFNAVVGLRQEGKAESAMNALKSMMKATARVRRDATEAEIPAAQLVVGDVVLVSAGDEVPADGRIVEASTRQIDESALTGESVPAVKDAGTLTAERLGPGDQTNMAFMNTPVTHGSGLLVITATGADTELGRISGMLSATEREQSPLTRELDTLTINQMTVVEVLSPTDRYTVSGTGYRLDGRIHHAAGSSAAIEDAVLPYLMANDAKLVDGEVVGDPTKGALLVLGHKAGLDIEATRERLPRLATLPFDPGYKLMASFNEAKDADGRAVVRCKYIRFVLVLLVTFVLTFLGATVFNLAAGEPFTPAQVLWIHFVVNAPFGFALGFDRKSPGLMRRTPRPRGETVLTRSVVITVGLAGLAVTVALLSLIKLGEVHYRSVHVGNSIAFTAFALCLIVAAYECRSERESVLTVRTFDSRQMNLAALAEFVLAVLVTQTDAFRRILGTTDINARQFGWALLAAVALLLLWELGKSLARRSGAARGGAVTAPSP